MQIKNLMTVDNLICYIQNITTTVATKVTGLNFSRFPKTIIKINVQYKIIFRSFG